MSLTFIGAFQALIGFILLLFGSIPAMFAFVLCSGLFGGSAAISLGALGGSSIPPIQFALVMMVARLVTPGARQVPNIGRALKANAVLIGFVFYGVVMAFVGPRLFRDQIEVTPLRGRVDTRYINIDAFIHSVRSLQPSAQNSTTAIYLLGTLLLTISAFVACRTDRGRDMLVKAGVAIGTVHVLLGIGGVVTRGTGAEIIFRLLRNGSYAQIDNSFGSFVRINGVFPEASSYATYAFVWFVFLFECWLRRVRPKLTGPVAMLLAAVLCFSTSTTAYISLGFYAVIFLGRTLLLPHSLKLDRLLIICAAGLALVIVSASAMAMSPHFADEFVKLIRHMTVDKGNSLSGIQRTFWAKQGIGAFLFTDGIGIGPGSFRSSSLFTAIMGCMGIVGVVTFLGYLWQVWKPLRASTYVSQDDLSISVGAAASWAVLALSVTASFNSPTCDPGSEFAVFAGAALALRAGALRRAAAPREDYGVLAVA